MRKTIVTVILAATLALTGGAAAIALGDSAPVLGVTTTEGEPPDQVCTTTVVDVPEHQVLVSPAVPAVWANFAPNDTQATFIGPPTYPTDARGTWIDHGKLPPGQAGPDGVYANGNPKKGGNWFYRQAAVAAVYDTVPATYKQVEVPCDVPPTCEETGDCPVEPPVVPPVVHKPPRTVHVKCGIARAMQGKCQLHEPGVSTKRLIQDSGTRVQGG